MWWKCKKGHSWETRLDSRVRGHTNCPYCHGIVLVDGSLCDSKPEAIKYIEFKLDALDFEHHKIHYTQDGYKKLGKYTYDFYFPIENKYVEVTSHNKKNLSHIPGRYIKYLRRIVEKRLYAKNVLKADFEFIQFEPTKEQIKELKIYEIKIFLRHFCIKCKIKELKPQL